MNESITEEWAAGRAAAEQSLPALHNKLTDTKSAADHSFQHEGRSAPRWACV